MMTTKKLIIIYFSLILVGVLAVLKFGFNPRAIEKIKLSNFENTQVVALSILQALRQEIKGTHILIVGIEANNLFHQDILKKLIEFNNEEDMKYQKYFVDSSLLVPFLNDTTQFSIRANWERFINGIKTANENKVRLLVVVPVVESPQLSQESIAKMIVKGIEKPKIMSLSISFLPREKVEEKSLSIPCNTGEQDLSGTGKIGCLVLQKARILYRKNLKPGMIGLLDQYGITDFVFAIHP